jgi:hypothetical protein
MDVSVPRLAPSAAGDDVAGTEAGLSPGHAVALGQTDRTLDVACRMLLRAGGPIAVSDLAAELQEDPAPLRSLIAEYARRGRLTCDDDTVIASLGLSAVPSDYEIRFGTGQMWAWCAKSALGLVSALGLGGLVIGRSPVTGAPVTVTVDRSGRVSGGLACFWPADTLRDSCGSAELEYCPAFVILESLPAARSWARQRGFPGEALTIEEAAARSAAYWVPILDLTGHGSDLTARLSGAAEG